MTRAARATTIPLPAVTLSVGLLTATVSIIGIAHPATLHLLERHPTTNQIGSSVQLITSLLVHDGWLPLVLNLVGFAVIGTSVERRRSALYWGALYLAGGIVGELFGLVWQPVGAGNSVASFGLIGGLVPMLISSDSVAPAFAAVYAIGWVGAYTGLALGGIAGAAAGGALCAPVGAVLSRVHAQEPASRQRRAVGVALAIALMLFAMVLCASRDIHGPPIIVGTLIAWLLRSGATDSR